MCLFSVEKHLLNYAVARCFWETFGWLFNSVHSKSGFHFPSWRLLSCLGQMAKKRDGRGVVSERQEESDLKYSLSPKVSFPCVLCPLFWEHIVHSPTTPTRTLANPTSSPSVEATTILISHGSLVPLPFLSYVDLNKPVISLSCLQDET